MLFWQSVTGRRPPPEAVALNLGNQLATGPRDLAKNTNPSRHMALAGACRTLGFVWINSKILA